MKILTYTLVAVTLLLAGCDDSEIRDSYATVEVDWNNDGNVDQVSKVTFSGITGKVARQDVDYADPNTPDTEVIYYRNFIGHLEREETIEIGSGEVTFAIDYVNDLAGNPLETHWDWDGDGAPNQTEYRTYNADGDITRQAWDFDGDGDLERERLFTFVLPGQVGTRQYDDNADGTFEYNEVVTYFSGTRRESRYQIDRNGDGNFDRDFSVVWTDNSDGTVTRLLQRDNDMDGDIDRTDTRVMLNDDMREYEAKSLSLVRDLDNDGNPDVVQLRTFNAGEQMLTDSYDANADGNPEWAYEYDYNSTGNLTEMRYINGQGNLSYIMRVDYEDWSLGQVELPSLNENT